jgi:prepilin signal peptidase PulO-like enzyme (type II secretory pathway)
MCPTPIGRLHTRVAIIVLPALLGLIFSLVTTDADWIALIGLYLLLGVALDALVYSWALRYQPPWMTFILALVELGLLLALAVSGVDLTIPVWEAILFYFGAWLLAIFTKIVVLPNLSLTYLESAGEFRTTEWSIPPSREATPIYGAGATGAGAVTGAAAAPEGPGGTR